MAEKPKEPPAGAARRNISGAAPATTGGDEEAEIRQLLEQTARRRTRQKEIPPEIQALREEYQRLKARLTEIRSQLKDKGYLTVRDYNYRGTPAYEVVKSILERSQYTLVEQFEEELKKRGYRGITGTIQVVLKNLKEDGLLSRQGDYFVWLGEVRQ